MDATDLPAIVSVDDHIVEPPTLWTERLPAKYRDVGPRVVRQRLKAVRTGENDTQTVVVDSDDPDGVWGDVWCYEDSRSPMLRSHAPAGWVGADVQSIPITYDELRPGCYELEPRLADMDIGGIEASLCFPNIFVRFCGQRFLLGADKELAHLCVKAYNDCVMEEWGAKSQGRLHPVIIVPLWDVDLAAEEVRRNAERGLRAIAFSEIPSWLGLPSMYTGYWDPLFEACEEAQAVVCMHIGSSSSTLQTSKDAPAATFVANEYTKSSFSLTDWFWCAAFVRFPRLKVMYSEAQGGWIPYIVARLDRMWHQGNAAMELSTRLPEPPSHYFADHVFASVIDDPVAVAHLDLIGRENICYEVDYPHGDGTWPNSRQIIAKQLDGIPDDHVEALVRGNAIKLMRL